MTKRYFTLNADFETNGFNKPVFLPSGGVVLGADHHALLEGAFQLLDEDNNVIDQVEGYIFDKKRLDNWNLSTLEFHNKSHEDGVPPFMEGYTKALDEKRYFTPAQMETAVITMLQRNLGSLDSASPRNEIQINLSARSVHFDASFIDNQMPRLSDLLSHQLMDVTTFRLAMYKGHPSLKGIVPGQTNHNALADCEFIREELNVMREFFQGIDTEREYLVDYNADMRKPLTWKELGQAFLGKLLSYFV